MKQFHTHYKKPLLGLAVLLILAGIYSYSTLKTGLFPDITFPKLKVIADAGQQPVDKMMTTVTIPLENVIKRTEGLDYIRSTTSRGSCEISVFLKWNANVDLAKLQMESLINEIRGNLLTGTQITVEKMNPSILPVMGFSVESNRSQVELKKIAQLQIKPFLAATPGVADVAVIGGKTKEYQLILNPDKLTQAGITPQQIATVVGQSNVLQSNGYISDYNRLYLTLTDNAVNGKGELENLIVLNSAKRIVLLKDVATVQIAEMKEYIKINANGKDVPLIAVIKQPSANLIDVNNGVLQKVKELESILPKDVKIRPYYLQADFVQDSVQSIKDVLWIGIVLAIVVVVVFLRSLKSSLVLLLTIPSTLALTLVVLNAVGYTFNIMTLGAIAAAIGLMIDDAVIVVEQIHRSHEEHPEETMSVIVGKAIHYLLPAMVGSSLSTIVIFIPFILMSGVAGAYFKVLAFTMIITLTVSFFITWLVLPALFLLFSPKDKPVKILNNPVAAIKQQERGRWIRFFVRHAWVGVLFAVACAAVVYLLPGKLPSGFLPEMDEGGIVLDFSSPPGTTLDETDRMLKEVDQIIQQQPEVASYSRRLGTQMGFFITEPNRGDYLIQLKKKRSKTTDDVSADLRAKIEATLPQLKVDFGQVIGDMLGDLMTSVQPVEIKVYGDNRQTLEGLSKQVADIVRGVNGTADVFDGIVIAGPQVMVQPNVARLAQFGITPTDFQFQLQTQLEGNVISTVMEREQLVNIRMIYPNALRTTVSSLNAGNILLPNGSLKPISTVATIRLEKGVAEIERENQKMIGVVTARLENRDLGSTLKEIQQNMQQKLSLPQGYHVEYGGSYAEQQKAFSELLIILLTACLLVFIVLLVLFRDFIVSFVIIVLAVLGVAGCLLALYLTQTPLNVGSYTGIIMIVGIIGENSIFTYQQFAQARLTMNTEQSIVFAIAARLRPKLMTASAAIIALLPLALGLGAGAQLHQPLAIAVIGGLCVALPLLLIVLPSFLRLIHRKN
ncbi:efflux RND transporter permease subunit [Ferruginibacter paludis]|uniref:efflux RND transporter permease subunit n=1 Tax=Ferruginibacter paludis TaxID=1310417 RepID=UPI0025B548CA|nr:efflux RND transporter permease subunit [Ferruginibacter paludis]MDN3658857.1 efflux RND transporter permease subunit [Ferruginibacter paludis]